MTYKKKLIEVALPLEVINRESAREKSIRHGHPSTLHLWWARRPLAACRAVLFAQLVDDPSAHPDMFPTEEDQALERKRLFDILERLVVWENTNDEALLAEAHAEILASTDGNPPPILDPFCGGGSIPLEAQRLGLEAHASDLNPVAVLITKALIEIPPKWAGQPPVYPGAAECRLGPWPRATGLAEDVRRYGQWMRDEADRRIGHLYPKATLPGGSLAQVIAWIWARTVTCPNPACGVQMPLVRSWWLGKKKGKEAYVVPRVIDTTAGRRVEFGIGHDVAHAPTKDTDGTVRRTGAVCVACGTGVPLPYIRNEGKASRMGTTLLAVVAEGERRRIYLPPTDEQAHAADVPVPADVPDTELPEAALGFRVQGYGMTRHADLFTPRQLMALTTFSDLVGEVRKRVHADALAAGLPAGTGVPDGLEQGGTGAAAYADSVAVYLGLAASRAADSCSGLTTWKNYEDKIAHTFTRQAITMVWDYAEVNVLRDGAGAVHTSALTIAKGIDQTPRGKTAATARMCDAAQRSFTDRLVCTDPPYYDNVAYADLSDFFYVWLRRSLSDVVPSLMATMLTPKADELVADPFRHGGADEAERWFEDGFSCVFARIRESTSDKFPITVFYAFKQSESTDAGTASTGWQTLLEGMLTAGWEVTATWPIRTELGNRMRGQDSNALASSIVLALRPRPERAQAITQRSFVTELKAELPDAVRRLQQGSIAPVDLAQAAIGPGMAVFSRHARVLEADGSDMSVRTALQLINAALDEVVAEQEGDFDADTRFCVKWFGQYGWNEAASGEADVLARATNTAVEGLVRGGVFRAVAGKARLLTADELSENWDPERDDRVSDWEVALRLARALERDGVSEAARLMAGAGHRVHLDAVKELAYLLYRTSEKRGWAQTALLFNGLGTFWPELLAASRSAVSARAEQQAWDV